MEHQTGKPIPSAATALLRLNAAEKVWPLFQDQPDSRLRSYVLHRLARYGVDPQSLFESLLKESDVSCQRAMIQGIGEFARGKLLSAEQKTAMIADLEQRFANDPDPGIHGTSEWALRQLGAGTTTAYSFGTAVTLLGDYACYTDNARDTGMLPVGTLRPNGAGLFDMPGNVLEWCQEAVMRYNPNLAMLEDLEQLDPLTNSSNRVLRGGSFDFRPPALRSANRFAYPPHERSNYFGFRAARTFR